MSDVSRREALGLLAAIPVAAGLGAAPAAAERTIDGARAVAGGVTGDVAYATKFFTPHELRTVHVLADLIIPRDARSGSASDAGVPAFIDFTVDDRPSLRTPVRGGLAWLDAESRKRFERPFVELADAQRTAILDGIAWPAKAPPELSQGVAFFTLFRDLVASGFYSSREGMRDLDYRGNTVVLHWDGCPPSACAHLGVSRPVGAERSDANPADTGTRGHGDAGKRIDTGTRGHGDAGSGSALSPRPRVSASPRPPRGAGR